MFFPRGWLALLQCLCTGLDALLDDSQVDMLSIEQIKEKFGTLRFYIRVGGKGGYEWEVLETPGSARFAARPAARANFPSEKVNRLIRAAEAESAVTCAHCGGPGVLRQGGWIHVACDACEATLAARKR
jgi:hypothetical protein